MAGETKHVVLDWQGGLKFSGGEANGPALLIDADNKEAPGPMNTLLLAAAACSGSDVVLIAEKMRVGLKTLKIEISGLRRETEPKRFLTIHFVFHMAGEGLDETKARRAIDLSVERYCSVIASLAPDIAITYDLKLA